MNKSGLSCKANQSKKGFSLIELLVVISIIGILVAIGMASYTNIQQKARDSARRSDVQAIAQALEQYFADSDSQSYALIVPNTCATALSDYFNGAFPSDPKTQASYSCVVSTTGDEFLVCADLEAGGGNATPPDNAGDPYTFGGTTAFCVANRQ